MRTLALTSLLLVIVLVSLSGYLRLAHSGIGCADWPACYGRIGEPPTAALPQSSDEAYRMLVDESGRALAWATPLHRLVASVLGLLVLFMAFASLRLKRHRFVSLALLLLVVWLAMLGIRSGSLHDPAVVMGNLGGGFAMLGLLGWLVFATGARGQSPAAWAPRFTALAVLVLALQILLGGLTSANFAATACRTLPDCHGTWWPGAAFWTAVDLGRHHEITPSGQAIGGEERLAIHKAHRLGSVAVIAVVLLAAGAAWFAGAAYRRLAVLIAALAAVEFGIGVASVLAGLPIGLAVAHNGLAGLLLLALLKLLALSTPGTTFSDAPR